MNNIRTIKNVSGAVLKVRDLFTQPFRPEVVKFDDSRILSVNQVLDLSTAVPRSTSEFSKGLDRAILSGYVVPASGTIGFYVGSSHGVLSDNLAINAGSATPFVGPVTKTNGAAVNPPGGARTAVAQFQLQNAGSVLDPFDDNVGITIAVSGTATGKVITSVTDQFGNVIPGLKPVGDLTKVIYFFKNGIVNVAVAATSVGTLVLTPVSYTADLTGSGVLSGLADNPITVTFS